MKRIRIFAVIIVCILSFAGCDKQDVSKSDPDQEPKAANISSEAKQNSDNQSMISDEGFVKHYGDVDLNKVYSKEEAKQNIENIILKLNEDNNMYETKHLNKTDNKSNGEYEYYIPVVICDIIADFEEKDSYILLGNIYYANYTLNEGVVYEQSGGITPSEVVFAKDRGGFVFSRINNALDGAAFSGSIKKMARGNSLWEKKLFDSDRSGYRFNYNREIKKLDEIIKSNNIQGYNHDIDHLADSKGCLHGYEAGLRVDDYERRPGDICLIKKDDYDSFLTQLKNGENYVYTDAIYYNKDTGICVKGLFDNYDYENFVK